MRLEQPDKTLAAMERAGIRLGTSMKQHDVVYGMRKDNGTFIHGSNWLRVRTENDAQVIFTLKRSVTGELDSIEHEVTVDSASELEAIILNLGYDLYSDLTKVRRKAKLGEIEICYDEVPGLGKFMEFEKICPEDTDLEAVLRELWEVAGQFGLGREAEETSGYDVLLRRKEGKPA